MSEYLIEDSTLEGIANAIRRKDGTSASIQVSDYAQRINNLSSDYDGTGFFEKIYGQIQEVENE